MKFGLCLTHGRSVWLENLAVIEYDFVHKRIFRQSVLPYLFEFLLHQTFLFKYNLVEVRVGQFKHESLYFVMLQQGVFVFFYLRVQRLNLVIERLFFLLAIFLFANQSFLLVFSIQTVFVALLYKQMQIFLINVKLYSRLDQCLVSFVRLLVQGVNFFLDCFFSQFHSKHLPLLRNELFHRVWLGHLCSSLDSRHS